VIKRLFFTILILFSGVEAKKVSELFNQIEESKKNLKSSAQQKIQVNKQLQAIAKKIKKLNQEITEYDKKLDELDRFLIKEQKRYKSALVEINSINKTLKELDKEINKKNVEFAKRISQTLGTTIAKNSSFEKDEKSVLAKEILEKYKELNQEELLKLSRNIEQKNKLKKELIARREKIALSIKDVKERKVIYEKEKKKREKLIKKLEKEERRYSKQLKDLLKRQTLIRLTLAKLKILEEESVKEAKRKEKELKRRIQKLKKMRIANKKKRKKAIREGKKVKYNVIRITNLKGVGDSYIKKRIRKYRGPKTIPPLRKPKVVIPFGSFKDPIYNMKYFYDYITLASRVNDKRVYNVLNGEVVFIGKNAMFGKYVIIKHKNNLHTIYAHLDKVSPLLKKGLRVKKGAVIGKIKKKLIFEATKNGSLINPKELINFNL